MAKVKLKNVKKVYPVNNDKDITSNTVAVDDFSIDISDGEFTVLVGPSGCGKSTVLRMIAGLEEVTNGEIYIDDQLVNDVKTKDRDVAMVFQTFALYPHMSVYDNIAYPLKLQRLSKDEIDKRVKETADILGITSLLDRLPRELSGGEQQRAAIGRAIIREPKVILMDEPLSGLDARLRDQMRAQIRKLHGKIDATFIYVTHDQAEAMTLGDRIVVMKDGMIIQTGTPQDIYNHPIDLFVADFIGTPQMNILEGRLIRDGNSYQISIDDHSIELTEKQCSRLATRNIADQNVLVGIRPDQFEIADNGLLVKVDATEMMGPTIHVHAKYLNDKDLTISVPINKEELLQSNSAINIIFPVESIHLFAKADGRNLEY